MKVRKPGNSGVKKSVVGLGSKRFGSEKADQFEVNRIINQAL